MHIENHKYDHLGARIVAIGCANPECADVTLRLDVCILNIHPLALNNNYRSSFGNYANTPLEVYNIRPESASKIQPEYIPSALREDYYEACLIRDKSPKASATLARRCLQGMIRDFCKISKGTLNQEIEALRKLIDDNAAPKGVTEESIDAIDAVRSIGNIGAHMERDINIIVDVDPGEAQSLIDLLEILFEEWYISQNKRELKLARVTAIAAEKKAEIAEAKLRSLPPPN